MDITQKAILSLSSVTVYGKVLEDQVVLDFFNLLEAARGVELRCFLRRYGVFFRSLAACEPELNLRRCFLRLMMYDDNLYSRYIAGSDHEISRTVLEAAGNDIRILSEVSGLSSREIKDIARKEFSDQDEISDLIEGLPDWETAVPLELGEQTDTGKWLTDFNRRHGCGAFAKFEAFRWQKDSSGKYGLCGIVNPDGIDLDSLKGYEYERGVVLDNTQSFVEGLAANNLLLYGDRGTGKSSTVKAVFNRYKNQGLRIIEMPKDSIVDFSGIASAVCELPLKFIIFIDDLSFGPDDDNYAALKGVLEGGLASRPSNVVIYATSNRRHFVMESFAERENDVHAADAMQEKLSLADRFGITVTFSSPDQKAYFSIVGALAKDRGIPMESGQLEKGAARWALTYNGRSPRTARQYIDWVEARMKKGLPVTEI